MLDQIRCDPVQCLLEFFVFSERPGNIRICTSVFEKKNEIDTVIHCRYWIAIDVSGSNRLNIETACILCLAIVISCVFATII